ncbi:hypothetical protein E1B28_013463 [Marasmius oreades]|uniref:Uncharacterized protein n=1 Tax=Marasmius oreades TaxID=181124 RepID=A0A9P7RQ87_9AGAR|nr:uncharacterized protein E1B28_013463 [Marasmius oreades]KAG7087502.1 hypothetical protein E1B28_013463 [Marasmius oreades]
MRPGRRLSFQGQCFTVEECRSWHLPQHVSDDVIGEEDEEDYIERACGKSKDYETKWANNGMQVSKDVEWSTVNKGKGVAEGEETKSKGRLLVCKERKRSHMRSHQLVFIPQL